MYDLLLCLHCAVAKLEHAKEAAKAKLWWPFTQHTNVQQDDVTVIDARCGEQYAVYQKAKDTQKAELQLQYDACASWWTQVLYLPIYVPLQLLTLLCNAK